MADALKKGRNEDLARKRLLHLGAEIRDLSGAAAQPERRSKALAGTRQRPIRQQARSEAAATVSRKPSGSGQSCGRGSVTDPRCSGTRRASLPHANIRLMLPPRFGPAACSHCEQAA